MIKVRIGELRDHVSHYVRRAERGETIVIVNRDRQVAVLQPWRGPGPHPTRLLGCLTGTAKIRGNIVSPIISGDEWLDAQSRTLAVLSPDARVSRHAGASVTPQVAPALLTLRTCPPQT